MVVSPSESSAGLPVAAAGGGIGNRPSAGRAAQSTVARTSPSVPTISSMCFFSAIKGGERAMMSPVVRISRFLS